MKSMIDKIGNNWSLFRIVCTDPNGMCIQMYCFHTKPLKIQGNVKNDVVTRSEYQLLGMESCNEYQHSVWRSTIKPAYIRWSPLSHNIWKMWAICAERRISIERTNKYCSIVLQIIEQTFLHQQNVILYWRPTLLQLHCRYTTFMEMRKKGNSLMNFSSSVTSLALNPWYQNFFITVCVLCIFC